MYMQSYPMKYILLMWDYIKRKQKRKATTEKKLKGKRKEKAPHENQNRSCVVCFEPDTLLT